MRPGKTKRLLELGLIQALADRKLQIMRPDGSWEDCKESNFEAHISRYRIKPEKTPHTLKTAMRALTDHGDLRLSCWPFEHLHLKGMGTKGVGLSIIPGSRKMYATFDYDSPQFLNEDIIHYDGTPFYQTGAS